MATNDFQNMTDVMHVGSEAVALLKALYPLLPTASNADQIESKILELEQALQRINVSFAKEWDFPLCQCTMPPQIMLWREKENAYICQNPECGRRIKGMPRGPVAYRDNEYF